MYVFVTINTLFCTAYSWDCNRSLKYFSWTGLSSPIIYSIKCTLSIEPYLWFVQNVDHFLLTGFRFNIMRQLLLIPNCSMSDRYPDPCGCDSLFPQDTLHFVMFCNFYKKAQWDFIAPWLRGRSFRQARLALMYFQWLSDAHICFSVASFSATAKKSLIGQIWINLWF